MHGADRSSWSFEDFDKLELLGSGGNADVHRARVDGHDRVVALKTPRMANYRTVDTDFFDSFVEEAKLWNQLDDHDNIVSVLDWGSDPMPWIALEYLEAGNLDDVVEDLSTAKRADLFEQLCEAVFHAHRHGITHGDLKPENVLLTRENGRLVPKIGDWGLATVLLEHSQSAEGLTLAYSAPEQVDPDKYGPTNDRTDIYQLGALGYELFTGRPPFQTDSTAALVSAILNDKPPAPSEIDPSLPLALDNALGKALSTNLDNRYESVLYLRDAVQQAVEGDENSPETVAEGTATPTVEQSGSVANSRLSTGSSVSATSRSDTASKEQPGSQGRERNDTHEPQAGQPDRASPGSHERVDDGPDGAVGRLYRWFHRPADELDFTPRGAVADIGFSFTYIRTTDSKALKQGLLVTLATLVGIGVPVSIGYGLDVIRATAVADESPPSVEWVGQFKRGLVLSLVGFAGLVVAVLPAGISPTEEGPLVALGALAMLGWFALLPAIVVGYGVTRSVRSAFGPYFLRRIIGLRYLGMLVGVSVVGLLAYFLFLLSVFTIVGIFFAPFVSLIAISAYIGRRYRDIDLA